MLLSRSAYGALFPPPPRPPARPPAHVPRDERCLSMSAADYSPRYHRHSVPLRFRFLSRRAGAGRATRKITSRLGKVAFDPSGYRAN
jgi:hypothetical protein